MSYITKILLKDGLGYPGTTLDFAEPAFDASNNLLYIGKGIGNDPIFIGPVLDPILDASLGADFYWEAGLLEVSIGSIGGDYALKVDVDASFGEVYVAIDGFATTAYVDGSLGTRDTQISDLETEDIRIDGSLGVLFAKDESQDIEIDANTADVSTLTNRLDITDASLALQVETYYFVTSDYELPAPTGSQNVVGIKNISAVDISIYTANGTYAFDNEQEMALYPMNTIDLYDYDANNWYII